MNNIQKAFKKKGLHAARGAVVPGHDLTGRDDVDAKITRGEAVLPVRTVDAMGGPEAVRSLITATNGQEPETLAQGGKYSLGMAMQGSVDWGVHAKREQRDLAAQQQHDAAVTDEAIAKVNDGTADSGDFDTYDRYLRAEGRPPGSLIKRRYANGMVEGAKKVGKRVADAAGLGGGQAAAPAAPSAPATPNPKLSAGGFTNAERVAAAGKANPAGTPDWGAQSRAPASGGAPGARIEYGAANAERAEKMSEARAARANAVRPPPVSPAPPTAAGLAQPPSKWAGRLATGAKLGGMVAGADQLGRGVAGVMQPGDSGWGDKLRAGVGAASFTPGLAKPARAIAAGMSLAEMIPNSVYEKGLDMLGLMPKESDLATPATRAYRGGKPAGAAPVAAPAAPAAAPAGPAPSMASESRLASSMAGGDYLPGRPPTAAGANVFGASAHGIDRNSLHDLAGRLELGTAGSGAQVVPGMRAGRRSAEPRRAPAEQREQPAQREQPTQMAEAPNNGLRDSLSRANSESQEMRRINEQHYRAIDDQLALQQYEERYRTPFTPKYKGDRASQYRDPVQQHESRQGFREFAPADQSVEQRNQLIEDYQATPEGAANMAAVDAAAANDPVIVDRAGYSQTLRPFEGEYMAQDGIDRVTANRLGLGAAMTNGQAGQIEKQSAELNRQLYGDDAALERVQTQEQGSTHRTGLQESGANWRTVQTEAGDNYRTGLKEAGEDRRHKKAATDAQILAREKNLADGQKDYITSQVGNPVDKDGKVNPESAQAYKNINTLLKGTGANAVGPVGAEEALQIQQIVEESEPGTARKVLSRFGFGNPIPEELDVTRKMPARGSKIKRGLWGDYYTDTNGVERYVPGGGLFDDPQATTLRTLKDFQEGAK